jgi:hypothetical protein
MPKVQHEVRDGLYGFIEFDNLEKELIDSAPFQRLRSIHQLAMCYQVYPGATHKRFEHSLGVMDVARRIFDSVFRQRLPDAVDERIAEELKPDRRGVMRPLRWTSDLWFTGPRKETSPCLAPVEFFLLTSKPRWSLNS